MADDAARVRKLLRQQAAIARFGSFALRQDDLMPVLEQAVRVCAQGIGARFCKICRYRPVEHDLLIEAGHGWNPGIVGHVVSAADESSPQGRAFVTGQPSVCTDLRQDNSFRLPSFYADHAIISTIDVVIKGDRRPYGVLEIDHDEQHDYDQHDIEFLTGFANVLAEAVAAASRAAILRATVEQMTILTQDKDRLLAQKEMLAEELQHRVRNNLQLVHGMLSRQLEETADKPQHRGIRAIARRVSSLATVYDHLLGSDMARTTDFSGYLKSLCANLAEIQASSDGAITLTCDSEALVLDLDVVTALGIVVTELVTNSFDHAFAGSSGSIRVAARRATEPGAMATLTIRDDGIGFTAGVGNKRHGLGLVRRLAEQIGGSASLTTDLGTTDRGTLWTVAFPEMSTPEF